MSLITKQQYDQLQLADLRTRMIAFAIDVALINLLRVIIESLNIPNIATGANSTLITDH